MYLDLEDFHPDTPHIGRVISAREGILLSIIAHLLLGIVYLLAPKWLFAAKPVSVQPIRDTTPIEFVEILPRVDRSAPPKRPAVASDMDRQAASLPAPKPDNPMPFSRGNTDQEKVMPPAQPQVTPPQPAAAPPPPAPAPTNPATQGLEAMRTPSPSPSNQSVANAFSNSNLSRYVPRGGDNFNNPTGGAADQQNADIQFDSKGVDFGPWLRRFTDQVYRNWSFPLAAQSLKGHTVIQFTVLRNGTLRDIKVIQPSDISAFTVSAENALKFSNPTSQLPDEYPSDNIVITCTFHYNENGR